MNTYIWYDNNTLQILGFISNDYSTLEEVQGCFDFNNSSIIVTKLEIPNNYTNYKLNIENNEVKGFINIG